MIPKDKNQILILKPSIRMYGENGYPTLKDQLKERQASGYAADAKRIRKRCGEVILTDGVNSWKAPIMDVVDLPAVATNGKRRVKILFGTPEEIPTNAIPVMPTGSNNVRYA